MVCCLPLPLTLDTPVSAADVDLDGKLHTHSLPIGLIILCEVSFISAQANYLSNSHNYCDNFVYLSVVNIFSLVWFNPKLTVGVICSQFQNVNKKKTRVFFVTTLVIETVHYHHLEYAIMKCLNLIGQCEGSKSLRATIRGLYM